MNKHVDSSYPQMRLRRLRNTTAIREMLEAPAPPPEKFIQPIFVVDGHSVKQPIQSLPDQYYFSVDMLAPMVEALLESGVRSVLLFSRIEPSRKTLDGSAAYADEGIIQRAIRALRLLFPEMTIISDVCLSEYTTHGHGGILGKNGLVENDLTVSCLEKMALSHASAGATIVAPSAMMDGQVKGIRAVLDANSFDQTLILAYSTKFASHLYKPFREAADSQPATGDRSSYQVSYRDLRQALRESYLDIDEGADMLMVKPAGWYLDVIARLRETTLLPLGGFQVSGEYCMIHQISASQYGDKYSLAHESLSAIFRAGADFVVTYWADRYSSIFFQQR